MKPMRPLADLTGKTQSSKGWGKGREFVKRVHPFKTAHAARAELKRMERQSLWKYGKTNSDPIQKPEDYDPAA